MGSAARGPAGGSLRSLGPGRPRTACRPWVHELGALRRLWTISTHLRARDILCKTRSRKLNINRLGSAFGCAIVARTPPPKKLSAQNPASASTPGAPGNSTSTTPRASCSTVAREARRDERARRLSRSHGSDHGVAGALNGPFVVRLHFRHVRPTGRVVPLLEQAGVDLPEHRA